MVIARVGAPRWLALILATWGILAACMAFIDGTGSFLVMRLLLGCVATKFAILRYHRGFGAKFLSESLTIFL